MFDCSFVIAWRLFLLSSGLCGLLCCPVNAWHDHWKSVGKIIFVSHIILRTIAVIPQIIAKNKFGEVEKDLHRCTEANSISNMMFTSIITGIFPLVAQTIMIIFKYKKIIFPAYIGMIVGQAMGDVVFIKVFFPETAHTNRCLWSGSDTQQGNQKFQAFSSALLATQIIEALWLIPLFGSITYGIAKSMFQMPIQNRIFSNVQVPRANAFELHDGTLSLPIPPETPTPDGSRTCSICLDILNGEIEFLQCTHAFHKACIEQWFRIAPQPSCPEC